MTVAIADGSMFDDAPCGYVLTGDDGVLLAVNRTFLQSLGYPATQLVGKRRFVDLLSGGGRIYHETHFVPTLRLHRTVRAVALDLVRADGSRLPVLVNADLSVDADGRAVTRIVTFDATERRTYERELLDATRRAEAARADAVALARTLQATLIPPVPPRIPGLDISAAYRPAGDGDEVGGDFYDVFQVTDDEWAVVIGDVEGKGVQAAVVTALARHTLRAATVGSGSPAETLRELNRALLGHATNRLLTAAVLRLRRVGPDWQLVSSSGGHCAPVLVRAGTAPVLYGRPGTVLGAVPSPRLSDDTTTLAAGDMLVLYTDGVTEARSGEDFYGEPRLVDRLREPATSSASVTAALLTDVLDYQDGNARDDIAVLTVRVTVPDLSNPST